MAVTYSSYIYHKKVISYENQLGIKWYHLEALSDIIALDTTLELSDIILELGDTTFESSDITIEFSDITLKLSAITISIGNKLYHLKLVFVLSKTDITLELSEITSDL